MKLRILAVVVLVAAATGIAGLATARRRAQPRRWDYVIDYPTAQARATAGGTLAVTAHTTDPKANYVNILVYSLDKKVTTRTTHLSLDRQSPGMASVTAEVELPGLAKYGEEQAFVVVNYWVDYRMVGQAKMPVLLRGTPPEPEGPSMRAAAWSWPW